MATTSDIQSRIAAIENDLRALAALAAQAGDWPVVRAASLAAECLAPVTKDVNVAALRTKAAPEVPPKDKQSQRPRQNDAVYPRFLREGGDLVKIGWSKRERAEYRHRAPEQAVFLVASAVVKHAGQSSVFSTDDFFPVIDPKDGSDVPSYQAYLVLRWFRTLGLVEQDGRSGYTLANPKQLVENVKAAWKELQNDDTSRQNTGGGR